MIPALGVSALTVAVVLQLLDGGTSRLTARLISTALGVLMILEGAAVLFTSPGLTDDAGLTSATHGVALVAAGAGIWAIAYRTLWSRVSKRSF
jgi:hypothetical protein